MKIPGLPQVLIDEFPSDSSTKVCIFTQPLYPVKDCSEYVGKMQFFCTEATFSFLFGAFTKKLPLKLFQLLPDENCWIVINNTIIDGLEKSFAITCISTGSVTDSVMLLLYDLEKPDELTLYTGLFKVCRQVFFSDILLRYKRKISEMYLDNTMAGWQGSDIGQSERTYETIRKIIENNPNHKICIEMEHFQSMDLLVDLARRHRIDVRLTLIQQAFFYGSKYNHLFKFDAKIFPNAEDLNKSFRLKDRQRIYIKSMKTLDLEYYRRLYEKDKIITIRLIPSEQELSPNTHQNGLIYVTYSSHAGSYTLSELIQMIEPKRIYPIVIDEIGDNKMTIIPPNILNEGCEIVIKFEPRELIDTTLNDVRPIRKSSRSFLDLTTVLSGEPLKSLKEDGPMIHISDGYKIVNDDVTREIQSNMSPFRRPQSSFYRHSTSVSDSSQEDLPAILNNKPTDDVMVIDSDNDDSDYLELMIENSSKKRPASSMCPQDNCNFKIFKADERNNNNDNICQKDGQEMRRADFNQHLIHSNEMESLTHSESTESNYEMVFPE